jgi:hypothetical protein
VTPRPGHDGAAARSALPRPAPRRKAPRRKPPRGPARRARRPRARRARPPRRVTVAASGGTTTRPPRASRARTTALTAKYGRVAGGPELQVPARAATRARERGHEDGGRQHDPRRADGLAREDVEDGQERVEGGDRRGP